MYSTPRDIRSDTIRYFLIGRVIQVAAQARPVNSRPILEDGHGRAGRDEAMTPQRNQFADRLYASVGDERLSFIHGPAHPDGAKADPTPPG